jgi:hypothetical protein
VCAFAQASDVGEAHIFAPAIVLRGNRISVSSSVVLRRKRSKAFLWTKLLFNVSSCCFG